MLDVKLNAPVVFVPEKYESVDKSEVLVIDMGTIRIDSHLIKFDPDMNYKLVHNPLQLYDAYNFT